MQRTNTVLLTPTREQEQQLPSLAEASARLWNMANHERRQALFKSQRVPTYAQQCKHLKDTDAFKQLGTRKAQAVLNLLDASFPLQTLGMSVSGATQEVIKVHINAGAENPTN